MLLRRTDGSWFANPRRCGSPGWTVSDGLLERRTGEVVQRLVAPVSMEQKLVGARGVMAELGRLGITSIHDIARHPGLSDRTIHSETPGTQLQQPRRLRGAAPARGAGGAGVRLPDPRHVRGLAAEGIGPGSGDEWLRYGALKIFLDSGVMLPPFDVGRAAGTGLKDDWSYRFVGAEKLLERIVAGDRAGFDIGVHVQGDGAIRLALDCFQHAARVNPARDRRHRLIHAWHVAEDDFARAAELGMVADVTADHLLLYSRGLDELTGCGPGGKRLRLAADGGLGHRDQPGLRPPGRVRPVARRDRRSVAQHVRRDDPRGPGPERRRLPSRAGAAIDDVLRAYTSAPAYSSREEQLKGTLSPGKVADLVVLSDDITRGGPDSLRTATVDLTVLAGRIVHR